MSKSNKGIRKMDEKYVLELGKMTNSIENLIKNQDKHYSELRDMLQNQRDHTAQEIKALKQEIRGIEKDRLAVEEKLNKRIEKGEKFDIKFIAIMSAISVIVALALKVLPIILKTMQVVPTP